MLSRLRFRAPVPLRNEYVRAQYARRVRRLSTAQALLGVVPIRIAYYSGFWALIDWWQSLSG